MTSLDRDSHDEKLLEPGDPAPVAIVNESGAAPLILIADHAGRAFPRRLGTLGLAPDQLDRHIAWDIGIGDLTRHMAAALDAPALLATYSRLVIDCNRRLDDPTSIAQESDGIMIPGNRHLAPAARSARAADIFAPYHAAIERAIAAKRRTGRAPVLLSLHSFTPAMQGKIRPWHIGILWNRDSRLPVPLLARLGREAGLVIGDNEPYSGRDDHGYSIRRHAESAGLAHALIEIRQDLIAEAKERATWAALLERVLADVLGNPELYRIGP